MQQLPLQYTDREYLINKIISGFQACSYQGQPVLVYDPSPQDKVKAHVLYLHEFKRAELMGVPTESEFILLMKSRGMWSDILEGELASLPKRIETLKVELYNAYFQFRRRDQIKKNLDALRRREVELTNQKESFKSHTCEGYAITAKNRFLICSSTYDLNGNKIFNYGGEEALQSDLDQFIYEYLESKVNENLLRELSKEEPWRSIWSAGKNEKSIFGKPSSLLSPEQRMLIIWSKIYDSINESPDCPPQEVLDDDDCLDGWLIVQNQNAEKEKNSKHGYKPGEKFNKADEVFIMAENPDDIARINSMNSPGAIFRKQQRMNAITKAGGMVQEQHMPDSQMAIREQAISLQRQIIKGNK